MFKINELVVYNTIGICTIVDIRTEKDLGTESEYYILRPYYHNSSMTIKSPVNSPIIQMREISSKEKVMALISSIPEFETIWINDDRQRYSSFKTALRTGECETWIKLIKTLYLKKMERGSRKLMKTDEEIMKSAEKQLNEEFAIALDITPEEVVSFITQHVPPRC